MKKVKVQLEMNDNKIDIDIFHDYFVLLDQYAIEGAVLCHRSARIPTR